MMSPWLASGTVTTSSLTGSSRIGLGLRHRVAEAPSTAAVLNAISELSTGWCLPSKHGDLHVDDREAERAAVLLGLGDALLDRGDEVARDHAADDRVDELDARAALVRLDAQPRDRELAVAAGLLLVACPRPRPCR